MTLYLAYFIEKIELKKMARWHEEEGISRS
jgi:hypothetical protein